MTYYYLQVDRLDGQTLSPLYIPLGADASKRDQRCALWLDVYRNKGFRIIHYENRPTYKRATRPDGVKLEIILIERDTPIGMEKFMGGDDDVTALH